MTAKPLFTVPLVTRPIIDDRSGKDLVVAEEGHEPFSSDPVDRRAPYTTLPCSSIRLDEMQSTPRMAPIRALQDGKRLHADAHHSACVIDRAPQFSASVPGQCIPFHTTRSIPFSGGESNPT